MRKIKKLILHCSASDDSLDIGFDEINSWHGVGTKKHPGRGWLSESGISCGYHYIVRKDGSVERGRPDNDKGAHCYGHNGDSIGIVWVGINDLNIHQVTSLKALIRGLMNQYEIEIDNVFGHYEFIDNKTCPNLNMVHFRAELLFSNLEYTVD